MRIFVLLLSLVTLFVGCANIQERKLLGKWQGVSVLEDGAPMPIAPSDLSFEFFGNGQYRFKSTLDYKEAGSFAVKGSLLHTLDTVNEASTDRYVQIVKVTEDSLLLRMNADGKEQLVKLVKLGKRGND